MVYSSESSFMPIVTPHPPDSTATVPNARARAAGDPEGQRTWRTSEAATGEARPARTQNRTRLAPLSSGSAWGPPPVRAEASHEPPLVERRALGPGAASTCAWGTCPGRHQCRPPKHKPARQTHPGRGPSAMGDAVLKQEPGGTLTPNKRGEAEPDPA